jgi:prephenate dehydrogenase
MPKSRVTIVGLGLIGGSLGLALKKSKLDIEVVGHDKNLGVAGRALKRGAVDKTEWNLINACEGAGLIVLAIPLDGIKDTLAALKPYLQPGVIVTDTATTKAPVLEWAKDLPEGVHFIGGNPVIKPTRAVTGRGIDAADAELFRGATYCLTPSTTAVPKAIEAMSSFATLVGAQPYFIEAIEHDGLMAGVQHLPTLLATALASVVMQSQGWRERGKLASADFRAATELVPLDDRTAREQFLAHRTDLVRWIDTIIEELRDLRGMCEREDADALKALIQSIAQERDKWLSGKLDASAAPAVEWESVQHSTARLFLGGLADRTPKRK